MRKYINHIVILFILMAPIYTDASPTQHVLLSNLDRPWGMTTLPNGDLLITERSGQLKQYDIQTGKLILITGIPDVIYRGQGGLLDVTVHPNFKQNRWVYLTYSGGNFLKTGTIAGRGKLVGHTLKDWHVIYEMKHKTATSRHYGSRILFDQNGYLFITLGDRGDRFRAQNLMDTAGSVLRLNDDGSIPKDNPFINRSDADPAIFSYGHRNIQGAAIHPVTGKLWIHEHGPQGGDEVNIVQPGHNYGWPIITYGKEYGSGRSIGEGTHKVGMVQPIRYWDPSIAPSGMTFLKKETSVHLLVGALKFQMVAMITLYNGNIMKEKQLFKNQFGRIRDLHVTAANTLYLLTDSDNGKLIMVDGL